ncbi:hypothetical protein TruAng_004757 [Truncatella angustata]|nr:hypothetical protein TruAng_004757 [Truncatella angustata]
MASVAAKTGASKVYILGRRGDRLVAAAATLSSAENNAVIPIVCDVTSQESINAAVSFIEKDSGHIDVLINNAGVANPFFDPSVAESIDELSRGLLAAHKATQDVIQTNTASIIGVSSSFLPLLHSGNLRRGWPGNKLTDHSTNTRQNQRAANVDQDDSRTSQIITVSSISGFERHGMTGLAYSASKAGATHLGKVFATMLVQWNIRSNVIIPGLYPSEMTAFIPMDQILVSNTPAGRAGSCSDIAGVLLYLLGKAGAFVNGSVLLTDGGRLTIEASSF